MKKRIFVRPTFFYHTSSYVLTTKTIYDLCPLGLANTSTSGRGIWVTGDGAKQGDLPLNGAGQTKTREEVVVVGRGVRECNFKEIMEERLLARGNFDDTKEAISKRCHPCRQPPFLSSASLITHCVKDQIFDRCATFQNQTRPVLEKYEEKLIKV